MSQNVPKAMQPIYEQITAITDRVCAEILDEEYAELARRMTAKLARKRPSPLLSGTTAVWACSIVYAVGRINFLFDKMSVGLYISAADLCAAFGVAQRTASTKSLAILEALDTCPLDPEWTLPSELYQNPALWMVRLADGFIVDIRIAPRELQEEAFKLGIIPFIPADKGFGG